MKVKSGGEAVVGSLVGVLLAPERRPAVLRDAVQMIEEEVAAKQGISGLALKGAFKVVRAARSDFVPNAMERLLPDFAARLEPLYGERQQQSPTVSMEIFLRERATSVATALLGITDERARRTSSGGVRAAYEKLRPTAQRHVEDAAPRIGKLLDRHLPGI